MASMAELFAEVERRQAEWLRDGPYPMIVSRHLYGWIANLFQKSKHESEDAMSFLLQLEQLLTRSRITGRPLEWRADDSESWRLVDNGHIFRDGRSYRLGALANVRPWKPWEAAHHYGETVYHKDRPDELFILDHSDADGCGCIEAMNASALLHTYEALADNWHFVRSGEPCGVKESQPESEVYFVQVTPDGDGIRFTHNIPEKHRENVAYGLCPTAVHVEKQLSSVDRETINKWMKEGRHRTGLELLREKSTDLTLARQAADDATRENISLTAQVKELQEQLAARSSGPSALLEDFNRVQRQLAETRERRDSLEADLEKARKDNHSLHDVNVHLAKRNDELNDELKARLHAHGVLASQNLELRSQLAAAGEIQRSTESVHAAIAAAPQIYVGDVAKPEVSGALPAEDPVKPKPSAESQVIPPPAIEPDPEVPEWARGQREMTPTLKRAEALCGKQIIRKETNRPWHVVMVDGDTAFEVNGEGKGATFISFERVEKEFAHPDGRPIVILEEAKV